MTTPDERPRARPWLAAAWPPALLGTAWLLSLFAPLLPPGRVLANRDIANFHLPLRLTFRNLAAFGLPVWNPFLNGGQPILSNPSYGAFYPPSWLVFAVPPHYALSLLTIFHAGLAFAGAWFLARRLGCGRGAAALAAVGFSGCGAFLSLLSALNLFWSLAWFPWCLAWSEEALRAAPGERWWRPALLAGGALGLQLLNGEPAMVVISGLALLALAVSAAVRRPAVAPRILLPFAFALALAAAQLVPTLARLADSPRKNLPAGQATVWSMPPQRLVEIVFPRFFGDPTEEVGGRFFGWQLNDLHHPYLESLYPGLLLAVLGVSALIGGSMGGSIGGIPRRGAWALAAGCGLFLALGRHNPVYEAIRRAVPVLAVLRFPEKFAALTVLALVAAGFLGWQRLLDERQAGRRQAADLPLALALVVLGFAVTLAALLRTAPGAAEWLIASQSAVPPDAAARAVGLGALRAESWAAVATAGAVAALLALCRWQRPSRRVLSLLAVALLAADLWHYGHGLLRTLPASLYQTPPPLAASLLPVRDRIFVEEGGKGGLVVLPHGGDPRTIVHEVYLARLSPYAGLIWQIPYVFNRDFELMLTGWGSRAEEILRSEKQNPEAFYRYLGVWNTGTLLLARTRPDQPPAAAGPEVQTMRKVRNTFVLPRFRFVPRVTFHPSQAAALAAARAAGWDAGREEQSVAPGRPPQTLVYRRPPRLVGLADEGGRIQLDYRAEEGAFFVAAMTFDSGWRARVDGAPVPIHPTAACQAGVQLPAGDHRLVLEYRDPFVPVGAAVSLFALLSGVLAFRRPAA
jgi:hypothetical protein